jgi:uncharacterized DUF497 family protein
MDRRYNLLWDDENEEHIARHGVEPIEVEKVVRGYPYVTRGRKRTYRLIGRTDGGRLLTVILARIVGSEFYVVTACDADSSERRAYHRR